MNYAQRDLQYVALGVSPGKEDVAFAIQNLSRGEFPGAFCHLVADLAGNPEYCCVLHSDGAGTKAAVAYIAYRETGEFSWFQGIGQDSAVMNLDDLACVGATTGFLLSNTIGRNAQRIPREALRHIVAGYVDVVEFLAPHGISLSLAGGETADVGDLVATLAVDSTVAVRIQRRDVIDASRIKPGHVIIGLASSGKATYETSWNSGIGSNGFTLARHILLHNEYGAKYPETFSSSLQPASAYAGKYRLDDPVPGSTLNVVQSLLSPTRTYLPLIKTLLTELPGQVVGIVHCSGGGLVKCKNFGRGLHFFKDRLLDTPPIFNMMLATGRVAEREMYNVFNMGQRAEIYCRPEAAQDVLDGSARLGIEARVIGEVLKATGEANQVTVVHDGKTYNYV